MCAEICDQVIVIVHRHGFCRQGLGLLFISSSVLVL